jgi:hypothetical protein
VILGLQKNEVVLEVFGCIRDSIKSVGRDKQHLFVQGFVEALTAGMVKVRRDIARVTAKEEWLICVAMVFQGL